MGKHHRKRNSRSRSPSRSRSRSRNRHHHHRYRESSSPSSSSSSQRHHEPKYKVQETKVLCVDGCKNVEAAERSLIEASIGAGTSVPDEIEFRDNAIYAKYPSTEVSTTVLNHLAETLQINGQRFVVHFHPYRKIDVNIAYDWYCDKCDYKNFARRNKCYRCQTEKSANCKLNYNTQPSTYRANKEDNINTCSLMVRGPVVTEIEEEMLLEIFQQWAPIKDIRTIRNKMTGQLKDFAFIEFFSPEETAVALKNATAPDFRVRGQKVSVMYSRNKNEDDYAKPLPYEKRQRRRDHVKKEKKAQPTQNYYKRQRQLEIQQEKQRPLITLQQLKEKREQELKKNAPVIRQRTEEQNKRRQAQMMARQWQKEVKLQNSIMYICVLCRRKFKGEEELRAHEKFSQLHRYKLEQEKNSLAL